MKKSNFAKVLVLTLAVLMMITGCNTGGVASAPAQSEGTAATDSSADSTAEPSPAGDVQVLDNSEIKIGFYMPVTHPFFDGVKAGVEQYAADTGISVEIASAESLEQAGQDEKLGALAAKGVTNLLTYPMDQAGANGFFQELVDNGCNIVNYAATTLQPTPASLYIGADPSVIGADRMNLMVETLKGAGNLLIVYENPENPNVQLTKKTWDAILAENPGINVLQEVSNISTEQEGQVKVGDALAAHYGKIDGIICYGMTPAVAIAQAMTDYYSSNPEAKKIVVSLTDSDPIQIEALKNGYVDYLTEQPMAGYGYVGCTALTMMRQGWMPKEGVYFIEVRDMIVSKDNVDTVRNELDKITEEALAKLETEYMEKVA